MSAPSVEPVDDVTDVLDDRGAGGRVVSGASLRVVLYAAGSLVTVVSTAFVSRHLGIEAFDGFSTVLSMTAVALIIMDFGLAALGVREFVLRSGEAREHMMRVLVTLRMLLMGLATIGMVAFALLAGLSGTLVVGAAVAGVGLILQAAPATYSVPLAATLRLGWVGAIDFARQFVQAAALVLCVFFGAGVVPMLGTFIPASFVAFVVAAAVARRLVPLRPAWDVPEMMRLLRLSTSFAVATSVGAIYAYVAQIVTHLVATEYESGLFALSFRVFSVVIAVAMLVVSSAYPILTRAVGDEERFAYAGARLYAGVLVLGGAAAIAVIVGAPAILEILGGSRFRPAADIMRLHGVAMVGSFTVAAGSFLLLALRQHRVLLWINGTVLLLSVLLTAAMASAWGGEGAAGAMVITEGSLSIGFYVAVRRVRPSVAIGVRPVLSVAVATALALGLAAAGTTVAGGVAMSVVWAIAGLTIFALVASLTGGVPPEILATARDRLSRLR